MKTSLNFLLLLKPYCKSHQRLLHSHTFYVVDRANYGQTSSENDLLLSNYPHTATENYNK